MDLIQSYLGLKIVFIDEDGRARFAKLVIYNIEATITTINFLVTIHITSTLECEGSG